MMRLNLFLLRKTINEMHSSLMQLISFKVNWLANENDSLTLVVVNYSEVNKWSSPNIIYVLPLGTHE